MAAFRFLHAADLHLDSPLRGLSGDAPVERIRAASQVALEHLVDLAIAEEVAFVVLAGDLYDGDWQDWRTGQALVAALGRLTRAGIRVVAIRGNHDAQSVLTRSLRLPDGATLLESGRPDTRLLPELSVAVHGQSFATREVTENLARNYPAPEPGCFNIGLLHTAATGRDGHAGYAPCTTEQLAGHGYDYWALGHVHTREELLRGPWIVFPGNLQGRHANEAGVKGASLVTVRDGAVVTVEHRALDDVRWARVEVDCTGAADEEDVLGRVRRALGEALDDADGRLMAARVILRGPCAAHLHLARDPGATREKLRGAGLEMADSGLLWIEAVRISTRPALDVGALRERTDAVGRLVRAIEALSGNQGSGRQGATALAAPVADYAGKLLGKSDRMRDVLGPDHPAVQAAGGVLSPELLERARHLLLASLAEASTAEGG